MAELPSTWWFGLFVWCAASVEDRAMFQRPAPHVKVVPSALEVSEARFKRFLKEMEAYERHLTYERTMDAFLDLYSSWKKTHNTPIKLRLVMLAFELHRLNSEFACDLSFPDER
ncbi:MAG: hypothetical protein HY599_07395 [Candidatus Omnitrophica bacterium]|nr:hypothetical protein [Candidatus Omnitrophota bacterium]